MALELKIRVGMSQRLVMTPSLQQAIKLLQMSKLELVEEVQQEMLENPVLEEQVEGAGTGETEAEKSEEASSDDPFNEIDYEAFFGEYDNDYLPRTPRETPDHLPTFENTLATRPDLADHLTWQLEMSTAPEILHKIGEELIGNIDADGYLRVSLEEVQQRGAYEMSDVENALGLVQSFDPVGVGARDLIECLMLQLRHIGEEDTPAETIVRMHLDKVQNRKFKELAVALDLDMEDLQAELEIVRRLDPRPGQKYNNDTSHYVVPDVWVKKIDGEYQVFLNDEGLPRLRISPVYRRMAARGMQDKNGAEAREYVKNKLRSAFRLIKSLEERQRTIFKVATSIVKFQRGFLDAGLESLRPMVLKDVAEDIEMHESTVSRVVNNKYMHTHRGLFEMRFFFHSGIASNRGGGSVSSLVVKDRIKKVIGEEDGRRPLSDSAIVKILKEDGLQIARRTVAKYREELKIPSSSQRKQVFK
ncbi:MAG: RNA polymerase factor sigma-54 [bacterium]|nr:RNA polymerase factor sigma-54 [bacterium]